MTIRFRLLAYIFAAVALAACSEAAIRNPGHDSKVAGSTATNSTLAETATSTPITTWPNPATSSPATISDETTITTTTTSPWELQISPKAFVEVSSTIERFVAENKLNGAGLIVVDQNEGVVYHNHWGEFSVDRISLIASTSKIISAGVLVSLHDQELLDLNAPIGDVIDYAGRLENITAAQLLSGSSGIPGLQSDDPLYVCMFLPNTSLQACAAQGLAIAAADPRTVTPDTEFRYGGIQLQIAGAVAEAASGKKWADLIQQIYVEPCATTSLGFTNPWVPLQAISGTYPNWDGDIALLPPTDNPHIGGGGYITTGDYGKILAMHLNGGRCDEQVVLSQWGVDLMQQNRSGNIYDSPIGYGMGWWTQINNRYGESSVGKNPPVLRLTDPGLYGSVAWLQPDKGFGAYLVVESTGSIGQRLANILYPLVESAVTASK